MCAFLNKYYAHPWMGSVKIKSNVINNVNYILMTSQWKANKRNVHLSNRKTQTMFCLSAYSHPTWTSSYFERCKNVFKVKALQIIMIGLMASYLSFTSWPHLRSHPDGFQIVHTYGDFIVLPHWETRSPAP